MGALLHGVIVAEFTITEVSSGNNTGVLEPLPWGANLSTVAAHRLAVEEVAACGGVGNRVELGDGSVGGDASTVVESLGGSVGPA